MEFWALVNWATSGYLLGTKASFKARFVEPILAGQEPKVSWLVRERESERSDHSDLLP